VREGGQKLIFDAVRFFGLRARPSFTLNPMFESSQPFRSVTSKAARQTVRLSIYIIESGVPFQSSIPASRPG